jgi:hypothetical protein
LRARKSDFPAYGEPFLQRIVISHGSMGGDLLNIVEILIVFRWPRRIILTSVAILIVVIGHGEPGVLVGLGATAFLFIGAEVLQAWVDRDRAKADG